MTDAVIQALESELRRERRRLPLGERLDRIAHRLAEAGEPARGHTPDKAEIDALWGAG
jgi:antitoxin VapB